MADQTLPPDQDDVEAKRAERLAKRRQRRQENREEVNRKRREYRAQPEVQERERALEKDRRQKPEVKAATAAKTKARREANLEEEREYERLQQARRREDPVIRARMREQDNASYQRHRDKRLESKRQERLADPEKLHERDRNRDPEKRKASHKAYRDRNRDKINEKKVAKRRLQRATDPIHKLRKILRDRHNQAIRGNTKTGHAIRNLGCSIEELKLYLESLFPEGMSWDNYGHDTWHIDHKTPLSSYDLTDQAQVAEAFHYSNLQPLWAKDNYQKGAKVPPKQVQAGLTPSYPLPSRSELGGLNELPVL